MIPAIQKRRSVRRYLDQQIEDRQLEEIIQAAGSAPSANALYPWELLITRNQEIKEQISKLTPWATHAKEAPLIITVIGHPEESSEWLEDCSIIAEHIWLEAVEQGLSSCWIQIRGNEKAEKELKEILKIPENLRILCCLPIGVPAEKIPPHQPENFSKNKIKNERYK